MWELPQVSQEEQMNKHTIIGISGKSGSGKTTLAKALVGEFSGTHMKFASPLYEMQEAARGVFKKYGYEMKKKDRSFLKIIGTEYGRECLGENIWCDLTRNAIMSHVEEIEKWDKAFIVVDDARFDNELDLFIGLKKKFPEWNVLTVRLEAPEEDRKDRAEEWGENTQHPSEIGLDLRLDDFDMIVNTVRRGKESVLATVKAAIMISEEYSGNEKLRDVIKVTERLV